MGGLGDLRAVVAGVQVHISAGSIAGPETDLITMMVLNVEALEE